MLEVTFGEERPSCGNRPTESDRTLGEDEMEKLSNKPRVKI
jgi:hypothetical protein